MATKQGAFESVFGTFSVTKFYQINQSHPSLFHKTVLTPNFQANEFQQRLQVDCMISDFTIGTVYFPIVNDSYPKYNIDITHLEEGRILQVDFTAHFGHVTCIHLKMVDLPNLKEQQGIPEPYFLLNNNRILSKFKNPSGLVLM